ncbi:MAG: ABC transporter permease [Eubacteriales bacterium]
MDNNYEHIPQEKFAFAQLDAVIHDKKFDTKSRGYFADAFIRFKKNKSSVVAACIIAFLILFAIVSPIISPYTINDKDDRYANFAPYVESVANKKLGILDGGQIFESQSELQLSNLHAIGTETGLDPVIGIVGTVVKTIIQRGQEKTTTYYRVKVNRYFETGVIYRTFSIADFNKIQDWQNETGIQVIFPYVEKADIYSQVENLSADDIKNLPDNSKIWYKCSDSKSAPLLDAGGNRIPAYSTNSAKEGAPYYSQRIAGDNGDYIYSIGKAKNAEGAFTSVTCRICYYNYYKYVNGHAPMFLFGTNNMGQDLFMAIGVGARFSMIFAILVSAINLTIGAIYGAIQGYYGGVADLVMDRVSDILSGIPTIVVVTLFQLHLASKLGTVPSFLFAFVLTGWIGMAALTRKQFYRFKSQEYVFAARTLGASDWRLMFKHIFPNSLGTIITSCALTIPSVISSETSLTYLGIINLADFAGTSIGVLMAQGQTAMTTSPHAMLFPSLFVSLLLISFNLFGNGLRDAFNPSMRGVED